MYTAYQDSAPLKPLSQEREYTVDMRFTTVLVPTSGTTIFGLRTSMTNLSRVTNGTSTYIDATQYATVFDWYRITHIKYDYIPILVPDLRQSFPIIIVNDTDDPDTANLANYIEATEYQNYVMRKSDEPWQYNCKVPKFESIPNVGTVTTTPCSIQNGFIDFAQNPVLGAVKMYADTVNSSNFGRLVITARVVMKRQR